MLPNHNIIHKITVAYAPNPETQKIIELIDVNNLITNYPITVMDIILASKILEIFPEIDLKINKTGVFGKIVDLKYLPKDGDRIEIYRPLKIHPMEARRKRAQK